MTRARPWVIALLLVAPLAAADPAATPVLGLPEALARVASGSQAAADRQVEVAGSQLATRQVQAGLYPSLDLAGGFVARDNPVVAAFGDLRATLNEDTYWQGQLQARYLLWDGGVRSSAIAAARAEAKPSR